MPMQWSVKEMYWTRGPNSKVAYKYIGLAYGDTHDAAKADAKARYPGKPCLRLELNRGQVKKP